MAMAGSKRIKNADLAVREKNRLMTLAHWIGWLVPLGLLLVLTSNVVALFLPFLEMGVPFKRTIYSLPNAVHLMWDAKLYWVAILIFSFSIVFPLTKTTILLVVWFLKLRPIDRNRFIRILEILGKWSMLDVFVVIMLMVLANDQLFFSATPQIGLPFFILAIIGNMLMSRIMALLDERLNPSVDRAKASNEVLMPLNATGAFGWLVPFLLLLSIASIVVAVDLPFLRINDLLLHSYSYSVLEATQALFERDSRVLGIFLIGFVGVIPAIRIGLILWTWFSTRTAQAHLKRLALIQIVGEWSMMSVFLLALGLILTEGKEMAKTQLKPGAIAICIALAVCLVSTTLAITILKRRLLPADS